MSASIIRLFRMPGIRNGRPGIGIISSVLEGLWLAVLSVDFVDYIAELAEEFRSIRRLLTEGEPAKNSMRIGVLHAWGALRPWTLSGHFHETYKILKFCGKNKNVV